MAAGTPLCILLTEDHQDTLEVTALLLRHCGHTVYTARTAIEARELAAARRCDLLVGDTALPDFSGLDLMRELRERYGLRGIAVSAYGGERHVRDALAAGFSRHLAKPLAYTELLAAVDELTAELAAFTLAMDLRATPGECPECGAVPAPAVRAVT